MGGTWDTGHDRTEGTVGWGDEGARVGTPELESERHVC